MSAATTFSYAQAAKGEAPVPTNTQSAANSSQMDLHAKDDSSSVTTAADASANTFSTTSEASESAKSSQMDVEVAASKNTSEVVHTGDTDAVDAPPKDESSPATQPDEGPETPSQNTASEKPARSSNRTNESTDSRKGRKGKKGRNSEKESEGDQAPQEQEKEVIPVKLTEAPPPAVNIWQQRATVFAKAKPANGSPIAAGADASSKTAVQDSAKGSSSAEGSDAPGPDNVRPAKSADGSRPLDQRARRNPRGSRVGEQSTGSNPPPVEDVSLWPTPDTAATTSEDIKRKGSVVETDVSSKDKQDDAASSKTSRPKYNVKMDINPSVRWETQMPQSRTVSRNRGGGQPGRSSVGRGGHASTASISGEKLQGAEASAPNSTGDFQGKPREEVAPRTNSLPSEKSKRFSENTQDVRKSLPSGNRGSGASAEYATTSKNGATKASKNDSAQGYSGQQGSSRAEGAEQGRKEGGFSGHKDARPRRGAHGSGRGGHNGSQPHGGSSFLTNGHSSRSNPYSPTFGASGYVYPGSSRGGRGRPMSMNGFKGPANGASKAPMQPLATDFAPYPPYAHAPHSAFPGVSPDYSLIHQALKAQIEYYFSATNLPKDVFLREHMDSQGFVPLEFIADFSRVRGISQKNLNLVREACADSKEIEYVFGDGEELLRRREGWEKYVLPEDKRKEHARKPGPSNIQYRSRQSLHNNYHQQPHMPYPYPAMSPPAFGAAFPGDMYQGYMNAPAYHQGVNGSQVNDQSQVDNSRLNAAVPEFAPGTMPMDGFIGSATHTPGQWTDEALQAANIFSDEDVAKLQMVAQGQSEKSLKETEMLPNGDAPETTEGYKVAKTNGVHPGPDAPNTPEQAPVGEDISSPTYWRLDGTLAQVSGDKLTEYYVDVRARALDQRQSANPGEVPDDMKRLYRFWAHSLVTHFNAGMYKEFRQLAIEDATSQVPSRNGLGNLLKFYHRVLSRGESQTLSRPELPVYKVLQTDFEDAQTFTGPVANGEVPV
ncbi:hypothetical protein VSDG_04582 [Cytospora chrysosperma]|uniref:HTH La-type RNA-binding domain-containing protein n=1 Tax=Cytospora chrysosperma TaxID=252740 RepID=A0A423W2V9_CYTCH|nr:hypothetical protein VSDG_04582 [Valsa sordida]